MDGSQGMKEMKWTDSIEKMALKVLTRTLTYFARMQMVSSKSLPKHQMERKAKMEKNEF